MNVVFLDIKYFFLLFIWYGSKFFFFKIKEVNCISGFLVMVVI